MLPQYRRVKLIDRLVCLTKSRHRLRILKRIQFLLLHFLVAAISSHPQPLAVVVVARDIIFATHLIVHLLPMLPCAHFAHRQSIQRKHTVLVQEE